MAGFSLSTVGGAGSDCRSQRWAHTASSEAAPSILPAPQCAASCALASGRMKQRLSSAACRAMAKAPRIGRNSPESESSPANSCPSRLLGGICALAARMPSAMGRSKRPDSLGRSAGARFTVIRLPGNSKPELTMAARTRSRASRTSVSGRPTSVIPGSPLARCTSTVTSGACRPSSPRLSATASAMAVYWPPARDFSRASTRASRACRRSRVRART